MKLVFNIILLLLTFVSINSHAQSSCSAPSFSFNCRPGWEPTYRQVGQEPHPYKNLLAYSYSGSEYFTGYDGYQCGTGDQSLGMDIYGEQAEKLYALLNLPEHMVNDLNKVSYKRLNSDGTTESEFKNHEIACIKVRDALNKSIIFTFCNIRAERTPRVFPCAGQSRVQEFHGQTQGGLIGRKLREALGTNYLEFTYSNGKHIVSCDDNPRHGCDLHIQHNNGRSF